MINAGIDFKQLFDLTPGRFLVLAPDPPKFTILVATDEYLAAKLAKREDVIGKGFFEVFPDNPADPSNKAAEQTTASFTRVVNSCKPDVMGVIERDVRRIDGTFETRFWDTTNVPVLDKNGQVSNIIHRIEDVTRWEIQRRKLAEQDSAVVALRDARRAALNLMEDAIEARRQADEINKKLHQEMAEHQKADQLVIQNEERFRSILDNSVEFIYRLNLKTGQIEYASPAVMVLLGYTPDEFMAMNSASAFELIHPSDLPVVNAGLETLNRTGKASFEYHLKTKKGEYRWVSNRLSVLYDEAGQPAYRIGNIHDITERKAAEREVAILARFPTENPNPVMRVNSDAVLRYANPASAPILSCWELNLGVKLPADIAASVTEALNTGHTKRVEVDCKGRTYDFVFAPVVEEGYVNLYARDITERKKVEETLITTKKRTQDVIDNATSVVYALDLEERFLIVNKTLADLLNSTPGHMIGKRRYEFMPKGDADWHEANDQLAIESGKAMEFEEHSQLQGRTITWLTTKFPLRDTTGKIYAVGGISIDITERKKAEEALRESEERGRLAQEAARIGTFDWNIKTNINTWSPELEAMYGLQPGDFGKTQTAWEDLIHPDDRQRATGLVDQTFQTGKPVEGEWRIFWPDGSSHWIFGRFQLLRDEAGAPSHLTGVNLDITGRKETEEALIKQAALIDLTPDAIMVRELNGEIRFWSKGSENLYGYSSGEAKGRISHELLATDFPVPLSDIMVHLEQCGSWTGELKHRVKDGNTVIVQSRWLLKQARGSEPADILESNVDITETKQFETRILSLTQIHNVLSQVNEVIVRTHDRSTLFNEVCSIITEEGHYPLSWIGEVGDDKIIPVSSSGSALNYLHDIRVEVHGALGKGPTGTAIRENRPVINVNFEFNPTMAPWLAKAQKYGLASSAAFPLCLNGNAMWALTVYSAEPDAFDPETAALFDSLSADISYALDAMFEEELRIEAESSLQQSEAKYRSLFSNMSEAFSVHEIILDAGGKPVDYCFLEVNEAFEKMTGLAPSQVIGRTVREVIPDIEPFWIETYGEVALTGESKRFENYSAPLGKWYEVFTYSPEKNRFAAVFTDITERKEADEALRHSEERYRGLVERTVDGIFVADAQGQYIDVNTAGAAMLGYTTEELLRLTLADVLAPEELSRLPGQLSSLATGAVVRNEWLFLRKDGTRFTGELTGQLLPDGRLQGILRDITERKSAEDALSLSEQRLRLAQEAARAGSWEWDLSTNENIWSDETFIVYGLEPGSIEPSFETWLSTIHPEDREKVARECRRPHQRDWNFSPNGESSTPAAAYVG